MAKSKTYEEFVEKFKPKRTTDDCYTPPEIYEVIRNWVCDHYGKDPEKIVRPFWPGNDYEKFEYPADCLVLDNPPFSILNKICNYYIENEIEFFLFAPSLMLLKASSMSLNHIVCDCKIEYENGAKVPTSFVTNLDKDMILQTGTELTKIVNDKICKLQGAKRPSKPKYVYPDNVVYAAPMQKLARLGINFCVRKNQCSFISGLDQQRLLRKRIFGGGLLVSD